MNVIFVAKQVGTAYRGEVLNATTYKTIFVTAHDYANETIAKVAARRTWEEKEAAKGEQA